MCWGFECGDGWYLLLHDLNAQLSSYLAEHPGSDLEAVQVKAKFGRLCFQLSDRDAVAEEMIEAVRELAAAICEITGRPGQLCKGKSRRALYSSCAPRKLRNLAIPWCSDSGIGLSSRSFALRHIMS